MCSCGREWKSANSWKDEWQECMSCGDCVFPDNLRPLLYRGGDSGQKPHETEHCGMCKKLGFNCRNYVPPPVGDDDDDDDVSVFSEASTSSSSSVDDQNLSGDGNTPVGSDDEDEITKRLDKALRLDD